MIENSPYPVAQTKWRLKYPDFHAHRFSIRYQLHLQWAPVGSIPSNTFSCCAARFCFTSPIIWLGGGLMHFCLGANVAKNEPPGVNCQAGDLASAPNGRRNLTAECCRWPRFRRHLLPAGGAVGHWRDFTSQMLTDVFWTSSPKCDDLFTNVWIWWRARVYVLLYKPHQSKSRRRLLSLNELYYVTYYSWKSRGFFLSISPQ